MIHVIGCGRGGTSLLMGLLDAHSQIEMVNETYSTRFLMSDDPKVTAEGLQARTHRRIDAFLAACDSARALSRATVWGHKTTTEHVLALSAPSLPDAGFVPAGAFVERTRDIPTLFILRDGRTCVPSKVRRTGQPLDTAITRWRFSVELLRLYRERSGRLHVLRFEDLVREPETTLNAACAFVGVDFEPLMLAGTANPKMLPEYQRVGFDPSVTEHGKTEPWFAEIEEDLRSAGYAI